MALTPLLTDSSQTHDAAGNASDAISMSSLCDILLLLFAAPRASSFNDQGIGCVYNVDGVYMHT